jgi:catechol 2,3-dioxygenase-like lactoylglutathione lyase family enzyme
MNLPDAPIAHEGFFATHFFTVKDQEKSKDFYVRILGGKVIRPENPCYIKLANTWIILNSGGGPTPDKPEVLLETPSDLNRVNSFLNLRVADIWACYKQWGDKGAFFLTEPLDNHGWEWRCYMRDPDGYLIEVGQYTQMALDRFKNDASKLPSNFTPNDARFFTLHACQVSRVEPMTSMADSSSSPLNERSM